jgi:hypothetical protein
MAYTPPAGNSVNFSFEGGYSAPSGDQVHFLFGIVAVITINSVSRSIVSSADGFDDSIISWQTSAAGNFRVEVGGSGYGTGGLLESGDAAVGAVYETMVSGLDITTWSGYAGEASYRFNIYVKSSDDIWTPYGYSG